MGLRTALKPGDGLGLPSLLVLGDSLVVQHRRAGGEARHQRIQDALRPGRIVQSAQAHERLLHRPTLIHGCQCGITAELPDRLLVLTPFIQGEPQLEHGVGMVRIQHEATLEAAARTVRFIGGELTVTDEVPRLGGLAHGQGCAGRGRCSERIALGQVTAGFSELLLLCEEHWGCHQGGDEGNEARHRAGVRG